MTYIIMELAPLGQVGREGRWEEREGERVGGREGERVGGREREREAREEVTEATAARKK